MVTSNTDYARRRDWEQSRESSEHAHESLETKEYNAFVERCKKAKVSITKLKKYDAEIKKKTAELEEEAKCLEHKRQYYRVGTRRGKRTWLQKDLDACIERLTQCYQELDSIVDTLRQKYFPMTKKRNWRGVSDKVAKDKQEIYNSREWKELRAAKLRSTNGLCEECLKDGIVTSARCVHHIVPIETARTKDEMKRLAIDCGLQGLQSLCYACHARIHKEMGSNTAKIVRQRAEARQDRWADNLMSKFVKQEDNGTGTMETDSGVQR